MSLSEQLQRELMTALNRLAKWRSVFAGWQLGTRPKGDAESDAVRDHREATIVLRAEGNALVALLVRKGVFTEAEWCSQLTQEADMLQIRFEKQFPGFSAIDDGITMSMPEAAETMKRRNFKP